MRRLLLAGFAVLVFFTLLSCSSGEKNLEPAVTLISGEIESGKDENYSSCDIEYLIYGHEMQLLIRIPVTITGIEASKDAHEQISRLSDALGVSPEFRFSTRDAAAVRLVEVLQTLAADREDSRKLDYLLETFFSQSRFLLNDTLLARIGEITDKDISRKKLTDFLSLISEGTVQIVSMKRLTIDIHAGNDYLYERQFIKNCISRAAGKPETEDY